MKIADKLECPSEMKCGRGIVEHELVFINDGILQIHCPD